MAEDIQIVGYAPQYRDAFARINREWIEAHFVLEEEDRRMIENPEEAILKPGGRIFIALLDGEPVGVCALAPHGERCFELAKMGVTARARGRGLGEKLASAAIAAARALGADRVYLETNSRLTHALALYERLGFKPVAAGPSPYARCNRQMELFLTR